VIPAPWRAGGNEVAVIGLARSGAAVSRWLRGQGAAVYASDAGESEALHQAAADLRALGAQVELGRHDLDRIRRAVAVVVSPGVPPDAAPVAVARSAGREVVAEIDVAARALEGIRILAITGTNGKTTTTALTAHLLRGAGVAAEAAGNIGRPLIELAGLSPVPARDGGVFIRAYATPFPQRDAAVGLGAERR
jgi:UDP-N-acetylmuramoylalanine--D-glutamate ligase